MSNFYIKSEAEFYTHKIDFNIMTNDQLDLEVINGLKVYNILYPPPPPSFARKATGALMIAGIVAMTAGAAGLAITGVPAAGATAATTATGALSAAGATATTTGVMGTIQATAGYMTTAGGLYTTVTGKAAPDKLMAASNVMGSPDITTAMKKGVQYQLQKYNAKIDTSNSDANAALELRIKREQETYAAELKRMSIEQAKNSGTELSKPDFGKMAMVATPFILYLLG